MTLPVFVAFQALKDASAIQINALDPNMSDLVAVPASALPTGVAAGTYIDFDTGRRIAVRGTVAATIALLTAGGGAAPAAAVYVDAITGNDATGQRGSSGLPFKTMAGAMTAVQSGDEVLVSPGTYSGAFTMAPVANVIVRGSGENAGDTILTAAATVDVCTLAAANRSLLFDGIQIAGVTSGRGIVGTGATAAGAWLNSGLGLLIQDCIVSSAAGNALDLTYANNVELIDTQVTGNLSLVTCGPVNVIASQISGTCLVTWDNTDVAKPAVGQSILTLFGASQIGGTTTMTGQARIETKASTKLNGLTGNLMTVAAGPVNPSVSVHGEVGTVDFQSTAAKRFPSSALGSYSVNFDGAILNGNFSVCVASGASRQIVSMIGARCSGITITSDALCDINARGNNFSTPTYASANTGALGIGTIIPGILVVPAFSIAGANPAGVTQAFPGGFTTSGTPVATISQSALGGGANSVAMTTTGVTVIPEANVGGNNAVAVVVWP